jgi:hypothetical protein
MLTNLVLVPKLPFSSATLNLQQSSFHEKRKVETKYDKNSYSESRYFRKATYLRASRDKADTNECRGKTSAYLPLQLVLQQTDCTGNVTYLVII